MGSIISSLVPTGAAPAPTGDTNAANSKDKKPMVEAIANRTITASTGDNKKSSTLMVVTVLGVVGVSIAIYLYMKNKKGKESKRQNKDKSKEANKHKLEYHSEATSNTGKSPRKIKKETSS